MSGFPWSVLGIEPTGESKAVRRAYAEKLKALDLDKQIEAYADLRHARDYALQLAKQGVDDGADSHAYGDSGLTVAGIGAQWDNGDAADISLGGYDQNISAAEAGGGGFEDVPVAEETPDQKAAQALVDLLYPAGQYSDEALTLREFDQANEHLGVLLEEAAEADIAKGEGISAFLSDWLAETWPRSSPLLERAATHFAWLEQSGQLNEPPALQFLNLRLRGMRFTDLVEQPDHRLHAAWMQLKKTGTRNFVDSLRISKSDVDVLLRGIRERYPEVESSLDPARVTSWEGPPTNWVARGVQIFAVIWIVGMIAGQFIPSEDPAVVTTQLDEIAAEIFGDGNDSRTLIASDSEFYGHLERVINSSAAIGESDEDPWDQSIAYGREMMLRAIKSAPQPEVLAILDVKRDLMAVAGSDSDASCQILMENGRLEPSVTVPAELRERERRVMQSLLLKKELSPDAPSDGAEQATVPIWAAEELRRRSGLSVDEINAAMQAQETPHACTVRGTLIEILLERPDEASLELLRLL